MTLTGLDRPLSIAEVEAIAQDLAMYRDPGEDEAVFRERVALAMEDRTDGKTPHLCKLIRGREVPTA